MSAVRIPAHQLNHETTAAMVARAQRGDLKARNTVIADNMQLAARMCHQAARRYRRFDLLDDMIQACVAGHRDQPGGLVKAIATYDATKGARFSTWAGQWLRAAIGDCLGSSLGVADRGVIAKQVTIRNTARKLATELGRDPTPDEVRARLSFNCSPSKVAYLMTTTIVELSIEASAERQSVGTDRHATPPDECNLLAGHFEGGEDVEITKLDTAADVEALREALRDLGPNERRILEARFGLSDKRGREATLAMIGRRLGLSKERIRQIEADALTKLRKRMACRRTLRLGRNGPVAN